MNEKDSFVFSVSDTGQGMSQERADKLLYLPKWSGSHGIKRERGYGLGLLLTKKLIDTLNGKMEIQSREGEGTTVFIHFKK
jgi:signal transduction histidine kinase